MLCVKPVDDMGVVRPIMEKYNISSEHARLLMADERGTALGFVLVEPKEGRLYLHALEIYPGAGQASAQGGTDDSMEIAEYLIRAAGSYALNRMLSGMDCGLTVAETIQFRFGIRQNGQKYSIELKELFKKCKNCGG
ncbi:MAG: hypothetical protein U0M23_05045 [Acutalibacteraceae bacterium]|nr:hypothetical protein [Acutalibacteraceae bacterium]HIR02708.1 hypothetical protein [Candidatus Scatovicinus merdipullorum]